MRLIALLILSILTISCVSSPPTFRIGVDGDDLVKGCPSNLNGKMWMTNEYAKKYYHWKNHR